MGKKTCLVFVVATAWVHLAECKVTKGTFKLGGMNPEKFIAKFSFGVGEGKLKGRFHTNGVYFDSSRLQVYSYLDEDWPKWKAALTCRERAELSRRTLGIRIEDEAAGGEGYTFEEDFSHAVRTHYWYFVVADCSLEEYLHETPLVHYTMTFLNEPGDEHLPADEFGLPAMHKLSLLALFLMIAAYTWLMFKSRERVGEIHPVVILTLVAICLAFFSTLFEVLHLGAYQRHGEGIPFADTMATLLDCFSDMVTVFLLTSFAFGWTLGAARAGSILEFAKDNMDLVAFVTILVVFLHIVLVLVGRLYNDDFNQFHDFEHWPGKVLVGLRVLLWALFAYGMKGMLARHPAGEKSRFLRRLALFGTAWFLSFPGLVAIASAFAEYLRHRVVSGGTLLCQTTALLGLAALFFRKDSAYYKVSELGSSGIIAADMTASSAAPQSAAQHGMGMGMPGMGMGMGMGMMGRRPDAGRSHKD